MRINSEINITPFVDVMLVLLVIFMVTSPMLTTGIEVDLPKTKSAALAGNDEPLIITLDKAGNLYLQETKIDHKEMKTKLEAVLNQNKDTRIFVRGDKEIDYGQIMHLFALVKDLGFEHVALVTESD